MTRRELPDGFGRAYRRAVFARTSTMRARTLAWVLLDTAYAHRSREVELGHRLLRQETGLSGWSLSDAAGELIEAGLLTVRSVGEGRGARTFWTLPWHKNVRQWTDVSGKRPLERPSERPLERPSLDGHESESESEIPLSPPEGGRRGLAREENLAGVRSRRPRSNAERIRARVARLERREEP